MNSIKNQNIFLEKENHTYKLDDSPNLEFTSVTTFVSEFFEKFDAPMVANKLTATHPKYKHLAAEELLAIWKKKSEYGTLVHEEIEFYINKKIFPKDDRAIRAIQWLNGYTMQSDYTLYSEKIIYSEELKLAGTIDLLIKDKGSDSYTIIDWKTSSKIETSGYKHKTGCHNITRNLEDCNFNHYSLQLSLYRYILEHYYNLNISNQMIVHITETDCRGYITPYLSLYINQMVEQQKILENN